MVVPQGARILHEGNTSVASIWMDGVQLNPLTVWVEGGGGGGHEGRFSWDPLPVFSAGGPCEQFWHGQGCPLFNVVHPAFPLPTTASPTLQSALNDGFGEAAVAYDMPKPCQVSISLTVARRGSCGPKKKLTLLHTQSLVLCSKQGMWRSFLRHLVSWWSAWGTTDGTTTQSLKWTYLHIFSVFRSASILTWGPLLHHHGCGCSSVSTASDWRSVDAGSVPQCSKRFFSPSQLSVQILLQCLYTSMCNRMH